MACSGIISRTPSKPQNDGGKLGHTIKTFMFDPRGGKEAWVASSARWGSEVATGRDEVVCGWLGRTVSRGSCIEGMPPLSQWVTNMAQGRVILDTKGTRGPMAQLDTGRLAA